jgi:molybdate transport system substrate-binding protein
VRGRIALAGALALAAGCSDDSTVEPAQTPSARIVVAAAAPLGEPLRACARDFPHARVELRVAGGDGLAAALGAEPRPDVLAAADAALPAALHRDGRLEKPAAFLGDEVVLAVPEGSDIDSSEDVARAGVALALPAQGGPAGTAARAVLRRLDAGAAGTSTAGPDGAAVVAALERGDADAGLVLRSDVEAAGGGVEAIELPGAARPAVAYGAAVVTGTGQPAAAQAFLDDLREGDCHDALLTAGFSEAPA